MGCWIVSDKHINTIVSWAFDQGFGGSFGVTEQEMAEILKAENIRSYRHKYPYHTWTEIGTGYEITFQHEEYPEFPDSLGYIKRAIECLDYQSCECPDYEDTRAGSILRELDCLVGRFTPGLDAAPWGVE